MLSITDIFSGIFFNKESSTDTSLSFTSLKKQQTKNLSSIIPYILSEYFVPLIGKKDISIEIFRKRFPLSYPSNYLKKFYQSVRLAKLYKGSAPTYTKFIWMPIIEARSSESFLIPLIEKDCLKIYANAIQWLLSNILNCKKYSNHIISLNIPKVTYKKFNHIIQEYDINSSLRDCLREKGFNATLISDIDVNSSPSNIFLIDNLYNAYNFIKTHPNLKIKAVITISAPDNPYINEIVKHLNITVISIESILGLPLLYSFGSSNAFRIIPNSLVFFEFIPFENYANERSQTFFIWELAPGQKYIPVITSSAGYLRVISTKIHTLHQGKYPTFSIHYSKPFLNKFAEHVNLFQVERAIKEVKFKTGLSLLRWFISYNYFDYLTPQLVLFIELENNYDDNFIQNFISLFDSKLQEVNPYYKYARNSFMKTPKLMVINSSALPHLPNMPSSILEKEHFELLYKVST